MAFGTLLLLHFALWQTVKGDNFPSLLTANASIAVIIDRDYLGADFERVKAYIENFLIYAKREVLKHGGLNQFFFFWTAINVKREFSAILSVAECSDTWRLFYSADGEHILHMAITDPDCPRLPSDRAITIPMVPRGDELSQLLLDFRTDRIFSWKSVAIMYDETLSTDQSTKVVTSLTNILVDQSPATGVSLIKFPRNISRADLRSVLSTVHPKAVGTNFMAIVSFDLVAVMLEYAKSFGLVHTNTQWMFVVSDTDEGYHKVNLFEKLLREGDNVAFVYNTSRVSDTCVWGRQCQIEELLTGFCRALEDATIDEFETAAQVSDEEWDAIRPTKAERKQFLLSSTKKYLAKYGICDNCTFWKMKTGETWGVEYQNINEASRPRLISVGTWRPTDGATMTDQLFIHVSHGFRGKTLPMVSFHNPPWQILKTNDTGDVTEYRGLVFDVIKELSRNLNFTYRVDVIKRNNWRNFTVDYNDLQWGYLTNTVPQELIDMVKNKTVALGACAVTVTDQYKSFVNYTMPVSTQAYGFLVARPRELSRALLFISPFTGDTWLCLCAAIVSMGPCLYYIHRYSPVYEYEGISKRGGLSSIQNCIWYMYGALLQQGGMHLPLADSARILVGAWWLVVLVLATTYCGNLVAFLTFPKIDVPITTIDDLIAHRDTITWSFREGNFLESEIMNLNNQRFRTIYDHRKKYGEGKDVIQDVTSGKHVLIDWKMRLQYIMKTHYMETGRCDFVLGLEEFINENLAMVISQDSPYLDTINEEIKRLHQVGLIEKWLRNYLPQRDRCWKNRHIIEVNNHTVNMDDMQGSFFVLFFGFCLATLLLTFEKVWFRHFSKDRHKIIQPFTS